MPLSDPPTATVDILRLGGEEGGGEDLRPDLVIREARISVYVNGILFSETPALAADAEAYARGILFFGGWADAGGAGRISVHLTPGDRVLRVDAASTEPPAVPLPVPAPPGGAAFREEAIYDAVAALSGEPSLYRLTGGVHSAALARADGSLVLRFEDLSRHCAVDKVIGQALAESRIDPVQSEGFLVSSGRIGADIVARAARARLTLIASVSAPTDRAVSLARAWGLTLCGFVRGRRMNVYTHPARLVRDDTAG